MQAGPTDHVITDIDPFDLPEWLAEVDVVWRAEAGLRTGHLVRGRLSGDGAEDLGCDLLAVDEAYPRPVVDDASRLRVHQAWRHGQVVIGSLGTGPEQRLLLAIPGSRFDPDLVLDALGRFARAVGAHADRYAALLRLSG